VGTGKQQRDTAEISGLGLRHLCRAASPAGWRHTSAAGTGAQAASRAPRRSPSVRFAIARPKLVGSPKKTTGSSCYVDQALKASLRNTKSRRLNVRPAARSMLLCTRTCFSLFGLCCPTRRPIAPPYPNRPNQQTCARATVRAPSCNSALPWSRVTDRSHRHRRAAPNEPATCSACTHPSRARRRHGNPPRLLLRAEPAPSTPRLKFPDKATRSDPARASAALGSPSNWPRPPHARPDRAPVSTVGGNRVRRVDADTTAPEFSPSLRLPPQGFYFYLCEERER
jgi:hypothetical protein